MQQAVQLQRGSRFAEQGGEHQRAVEQGKGDSAAHGFDGFGGVGFGGFIGGVGCIGGRVCVGQFCRADGKGKGAAALRAADGVILAAHGGKVAEVHLLAVLVGVQRQRDGTVRRGKQQCFGCAQFVHRVGDAQIAGGAQRLVAHAGLHREDAAARDRRGGEYNRAVAQLGLSERVRDGERRVLRRQRVRKRLARAVFDRPGDSVRRTGKQQRRVLRQHEAGRGGGDFVLFIERRRVGDLALTAVRGAVLHRRRAARKGDERRGAAAVEVDGIGAAECRQRVGKRRQRQPACVAGASAVGDEQKIAAVRLDAERRAGLTGLFVFFVDHAVHRFAVPKDDIAAAERGDCVLKPAFARDAHREGGVRREHGIVRGGGKGVRHDEHGRIRGNLAVLLRGAHRSDGGAHLAAEREAAVEL